MSESSDSDQKKIVAIAFSNLRLGVFCEPLTRDLSTVNATVLLKYGGASNDTDPIYSTT